MEGRWLVQRVAYELAMWNRTNAVVMQLVLSCQVMCYLLLIDKNEMVILTFVSKLQEAKLIFSHQVPTRRGQKERRRRAAGAYVYPCRTLNIAKKVEVQNFCANNP